MNVSASTVKRVGSVDPFILRKGSKVNLSNYKLFVKSGKIQYGIKQKDSFRGRDGMN